MKKGIVLAVLAMAALPALAEAQRTREDQLRRNQIRLMEGVLMQAVRLGAEEVGAEMEKFEPAGVTALTGTPRARGFVLEGYGVFFDVEIPELNQSVVWSMMNFRREQQVGNALESLRAALNAIPDGASRLQAESYLQQISKTVGPAPDRLPARGVQPPQQGVVTAAAATMPMPDPDALYTEAVKGALIAAMLDHSLQMNLGPDEWLTVAARASEGPLSPSALSDSITIILKVKGSDLTAYHGDKSKRDEILQKVKLEAKVF